MSVDVMFSVELGCGHTHSYPVSTQSLVGQLLHCATCVAARVVVRVWGRDQGAELANDTAEPFGISAETWPGLAKLVEECGEVIQIIGKLIATGGRTDHWSGTDLAKALEDELGDVEAAITFVLSVNFERLDHRRIYDRAHRKANIFHDWHNGIEDTYAERMEGYS